MNTEPISVLLVDDEEEFVIFLAQQLREQFGFAASTLSSGTELIARLQHQNNAVDVIVLDHMMPTMTGLSVLQWMHEQKCQTPVIMLTGAGSEDLAVEAMKLGAYDYLRKDQLTLARLASVIAATHERHLFRVTKMLEEERLREIRLNDEATDKVRDVLNALAPHINESFASITTEVSERLPRFRAVLGPAQGQEFERALEELRRHVTLLEAGVQGLLSLYQILYAHHTQAHSIEELRQQIARIGTQRTLPGPTAEQRS